MLRRTVRLACVMAAPLACGRSGDHHSGFVTRDSAGVEVVENGERDRPLDWVLEPKFAIGGQDEGPESFTTLRGAVAAGPGGSLYVLDVLGMRLIAFDSLGQLRWANGRAGGGPGEFGEHAVWSIAVTPAGHVEALDLGNMRRTRYDATGRFVRSEPLSFPPYRSRSVYTDSGLAVTLPWQWGQRLVSVLGSDTNTIVERGAAEGAFVRFERCGQVVRLPALFSTQDLRWAGNPTVVALNLRPQYEIDLYQGVWLVRRVRRAVAPRAPSVEAMRAWYPDGFVARRDGTTCRRSAEHVATDVGWAPLVPSIRDLAVAPNGEIWVVRDPAADGRSAVDVLTVEGRYLGTLAPGTPVPIAFTAAGDVIALETNDVDVQRLVVYQVRRQRRDRPPS